MCPHCERMLYKSVKYEIAPGFIAFNVNTVKLEVTAQIKLPEQGIYRLCGLIYFGEFHFTSRIVDHSGEVYYHDGMKTGEKLVFEGNLLTLDSKKLHKAKKRRLSVLIYTNIL